MLPVSRIPFNMKVIFGMWRARERWTVTGVYGREHRKCLYLGRENELLGKKMISSSACIKIGEVTLGPSELRTKSLSCSCESQWELDWALIKNNIAEDLYLQCECGGRN